MNPRLEALHAYPFERLARLKAGISPPAALKHIAMSIGELTRELYAREHVTVLPGSYLGRAHERDNPGAGRVRISLVPPLRQCVEAAERIRDFLHKRPPPVPNSRA